MNLIICATPLHMLIAKRIIEQYPQERFYLLTYLNNLNPKMLYYHKQLAKSCVGDRIVIKSSKIGYVYSYINLLNLLFIGFQIPKCQKVFLAHTGESDIHVMLIRQKYAEVITFDDGTKNIISSPIKYTFNVGKLYQFLYKYYIPDDNTLNARRIKHYSIYQYPNNAGPSEYIPLFQGTDKEEQKAYTQEIRILLGQPIYEFDKAGNQKNISFTERIIKDYQIKKYFPHPREEYRISDVEYIDTPLIIEDYLIQELKEHPERKYIIYSYCSTAVLNLQGISKQIEFVLLQPNDMPEFLESTYKLFDKLGFPITQLPYGANDLIQGQD